MVWKKIKFEIGSECPLLVHNGQLADPTNPIVIDIAKLTSKRKKTLADYKRISELEFKGGLYLKDGKPCLPSELIEATFIGAAAKTKQKQDALSGLQVRESALLQYDGPKDVDKLWGDSNYRLVTRVNIKKNKITRTRPKFDKWQASFIIEYNDELINESSVIEWAKTAGGIGFGDWRPKFGRFKVEKYTSM